jgi:hypothetical protein
MGSQQRSDQQSAGKSFRFQVSSFEKEGRQPPGVNTKSSTVNSRKAIRKEAVSRKMAT